MKKYFLFLILSAIVIGFFGFVQPVLAEQVGACCVSAALGTCMQNTTRERCLSNGGDYWDNRDCSVCPDVPAVTGACCARNSCSVSRQNLCQGIYMGDNRACDATICVGVGGGGGGNGGGTTTSGFGITLSNPLCLGGGANGPNCTNDFPELISKIIQYVVLLITGLATIMLVYAGFLFVTSAGNEAKLGTAKKALLYAIIGIAVALAGQGFIMVIRAVLNVPAS